MNVDIRVFHVLDSKCCLSVIVGKTTDIKSFLPKQH